MFSTYVLMYGNYPEIHDIVLDSILKRFPKDRLSDVAIWCNQVCKKTLDKLRKTEFKVYESEINYPKYPVMRRMFSDGISNPWILWLDDDTRIVSDDWYSKMQQYIKDREKENICFIGQGWVCGDFDKRMGFLKASKWWRARPLEVNHHKKQCCWFPIGGYWWLRTDVCKLIDWPDPRLSHNGGDTLLAEAVRQQGLPFHKYGYGVKTQEAPRRGISERPAGWNGSVVKVIQPGEVKVWYGEKERR